MPSPRVDLGARACEIFFLCSGFLVGLKNTYNSKWKGTWEESCNYVFHKVIRFYMLYCVCNLFFGIVNRDFSSRGWGIVFLINSALLQAWYPRIAMSFNGTGWFLSSLMFCYFLSPAISRLLNGKTLRGAICAVSCGFVRFLIEYVNTNYPTEIGSVFLHVNPVVRALEFSMAMFMAPLFIKVKRYSDQTHTRLIPIMEILITILTVLMTIRFTNLKYNRFFFSVVYLVFIFVISLQRGIISRFLSLPFFAKFSEIQMEFYLVHMVGIVLAEAIMLRLRLGNIILSSILGAVLTALIAITYKYKLENQVSGFLYTSVNKIHRLL